HEDDPERAARAALAIRDFAVEEGLELRVGITTGEALVSLDASPSEGEGMASDDVVNTAARLQGGAPVNGVLVDETTYRATRAAVDFDEPQTIEAKGKAEPIAVRRALEVRSRPGMDVAHEARAKLVGREQEVDVLRDALARVCQSRTSQLLTLVGVPGIGKSRLVYELSQIVEADAELITWRQGRCLAYGDGITLWALGEIVKAQAGIHEQDPPAEASAKIRRAVEVTIDDETDARWVELHLLTLVGLAEESELGRDRGNEAFSAWRRFFEAMADRRPLVLLVEDLHWADESLLDFLDELVDWVTDVPLLVVGTARPELLERRPGWGGGKLNATTLALQPLSNEETASLIEQVLDRPLLAADAQLALLERAGGNPLYAEQYAELYLEQGSTEALALPETLQGIISARLDGLPREEKELLRDASVMGKVFWTGALRGEPAEISAALHSLARKAFVRQQRRSSVEGESEFAFAHALVRDVAYRQIARADRAEKHRHAAEWIESLGRLEDHAEMLAYHWGSALALAGAAGASNGELSERARIASRSAGDRAFALNAFPSAAKHYASALEIWPTNDSRPELLFRLGHALFVAGDEGADRALEEARDALVASGHEDTAAEAEAFLAELFWLRGRNDEMLLRLQAAEKLVAGAEPSAGAARVLAWSARYQFLAGDRENGLHRAEEAFALAEQVGADELRLHALITVGSAKEFLGDVTGRHDLERAVEIGRAMSSPLVATALNNLSVVIDTTDARRVVQLEREAHFEAERIGDVKMMRFLRGNLIWGGWMLGDWDEAMAEADRFIAECEQGSPHILEGQTRLFRGYITLARGNRSESLEDFRRALELARESGGDRDTLIPALVRGAWAYLQVGRALDARAAYAEAIPLLKEHQYARPWLVSEVASELGETAAVREVLADLPSSQGREAMIAVLDGDFEKASETYAAAGLLLLAAGARLRLAEQLVATGRRVEGADELEKALAFYRPIGATLFVERGERLLAKSA
ncbi:MAG: AAA family ATPase, partial [Actinobacteria bacterium]|nr:AAA family ATPase [Actinomycetota bacterium]